MGAFREKQFNYANEFLSNSLLYKQIEDKVYNLLAGKKINTALIAESVGMPRQTAYYKLKTRGFSAEELEKLARKAVDIYKFV